VLEIGQDRRRCRNDRAAWRSFCWSAGTSLWLGGAHSWGRLGLRPKCCSNKARPEGHRVQEAVAAKEFAPQAWLIRDEITVLRITEDPDRQQEADDRSTAEEGKSRSLLHPPRATTPGGTEGRVEERRQPAKGKAVAKESGCRRPEAKKGPGESKNRPPEGQKRPKNKNVTKK